MSKKKIFFAAYSLDFGGIETALITLLKYLAKSYDITLVLEKKQGVFLNQVPENVEIFEYKKSNFRIPLFRKMHNLLKQKAFKLKYGNKFDFSVCYATYSLPCSFLARTASSKSALWVHNNYMNFYEGDIGKYRSFFKRLKVDEFKKIVFVSQLDKKIFIAQFPECSKKAVFCNNLIDYEKVLNKSNDYIDNFEKTEYPTFINVGRHDEKQKKLSRIIEATKRLNNEEYKFRVVFVGDGEATKEYKELAKDIDNIVFLGAKKNPYPYIKQSDCFIMSSQFEGYPVVLIEAQILGKPIVTTDISDAKIDIDNKYGIVVKNSEEGVYQGMKKYLDEGFTTQEFDANKFNEEIIEKINKIIKD